MDRVQMSGTDEHAARVASIQKESIQNYLKWQVIQLAIHSTACVKIDYE